MRRNSMLYIVVETDTERQIGDYGRDKWVSSVNLMGAYSSPIEASLAAKKWQRNHDEDRNNGCSPDNIRRYHVESVDFVK